MAVRSHSGTTLPGNSTIIPSEPKWVFHAIYQLAFLHFYSSNVCCRNQLVLMNKDDAEYKSFESVIESMDVFKRSTVMLCTFHGIWLAFKKDLLPLLDQCQYGKLYGKWTICCTKCLLRPRKLYNFCYTKFQHQVVWSTYFIVQNALCWFECLLQCVQVIGCTGCSWIRLVCRRQKANMWNQMRY